MPVVLLILGLLVTALLIPGAPRRVAQVILLCGLCLVILPASIIVGAAGWTARLTLLEPSFHLAILKEVRMYDAIPEVVSGMALMHLDDVAGLKAAQREAVAGALRAAVSASISPAWAEGEITRILTGSLKFLRGGGQPPDLRVDMTGPKAGIMKNLSEAGLPAPVLAEARKILSAIPDRLSPPGVLGDQSAHALLPVRQVVQVVMIAGPAVTLGAAATLFLAWLVAGRGGPFPLWAGSGCLIGGLAVPALTLVGRMYLLQATGSLVMPAPFSSLPLQVWVETVALRVLGAAQLAGAVIAAGGAALVALPRLIRRPSGATTD